ncbi:MAG: ribosomal-processing cysteine protease Prp [Oscillospiraceae bacterium]|jgi:uncharacterized protein YsxB (DUF464 family)|nr:ribosomal-processing cysteine protease Prp [Oscillospiraceae bacterium]
MTRIRVFRGASGGLRGFSVAGHTGAGGAGNDIVCAGVSALAQTAVNALEAIAGVRARVIIAPGLLVLRLPEGIPPRRRRDAQIILRTALQGFTDIAAAYPLNVRITE